MIGLWTQLDQIGGRQGVPETWRRAFGKEFEAFKRAFLSKTGYEATRYPSPHICECDLRVVTHADKTLVGVSECGSGGCRDIDLKPADVELWALDIHKLGRAIAWAFDCTPKRVGEFVRYAMEVAAFGPSATTVFLTLPVSHDEFQQVIAHLVAEERKPFILFGLTSQFVDHRTKNLLAHSGSEFFDLASQTTFTGDGQLKALTPAQELFARFLPPKAGRENGSELPAGRFRFRQAGSMCNVVFEGSPEFHLNKTDGAKYLDYLLHHPNKAVRAVELEREIKPVKGDVREENSIQTTVDAQAKREARQELAALKAELEEAQAEGQTTKVKRLKGEIIKVQAVAGNESLLGGDTGERARDNVRKAIERVIAKLRKGNKSEQAFGVHIGRFVSLGYDVSYNQPESMNWE